MTTKDEILATARWWVATDPAACRGDVERLGLEHAAEYNLDLAAEQVRRGDARLSPLMEPARPGAARSPGLAALMVALAELYPFEPGDSEEAFAYQDGMAYMDIDREIYCACCGQKWAACWCDDPE